MSIHVSPICSKFNFEFKKFLNISISLILKSPHYRERFIAFGQSWATLASRKQSDGEIEQYF